MRAQSVMVGLLLVTIATVTAAPTAVAGGPTVALITWPDGSTEAVHYTDSSYTALLGAVADPTSSYLPPTPAAPDGEAVTIAWLLHEAQPWRIDEVYPSEPGGPVIATRSMEQAEVAGLDPPTDLFELTPQLHTTSQSTVLVALLDQLKQGKASSPIIILTKIPAAMEVVAATPTAEREPAEPNDARLWWGIAGLLLGVLATTAAHRIHTRNATLGDESNPDSSQPKITLVP